MKRGAIFDMDGTLINTERFYTRWWVETADKFDLERKPALGAAMGGSSLAKAPDILREFYPNENFDIDEYIKSTVESVKAEINKNLELMPGTENILQYFKSQNILMAVASSTLTELVEKNLERVGIIKYFSAIVGGDQVKRSKPESDIFLKAAEKLKLNPRDCYVFEDSFNGILAGHSAGALTVMIPDQVQPDEEIKKICKVYDSLNDAMQDIKNGNI